MKYLWVDWVFVIKYNDNLFCCIVMLIFFFNFFNVYYSFFRKLVLVRIWNVVCKDIVGGKMLSFGYR